MYVNSPRLHNLAARAHEQRFASLAKFLPFLPVFGGGVVRFQYVHQIRDRGELTIDLFMLEILQGRSKSAAGMIGRLLMLSGARLLKLVVRTVSLFRPLFPLEEGDETRG
jgi:hypothetical protein